MNTHDRDSLARAAHPIDTVEHGALAAAVEQAADGVLMTDVHGIIQYVNPSFTAMTGYSSEDVAGQTPRILKSGFHPADFYSEMWETIRSGRVWQGEVVNRRKDGTTYQEETRISSVRGAGGEIVAYVSVRRDITDRKRTELLLKQSESRLRIMADSSPIGIWRSNAQGSRLFVNFTFRQFCGASSEELSLSEWGALLTEEDFSSFCHDLDLSLKEHAVFGPCTYRTRRCDGEWRWIESYAVPHVSDNGEFLGLVGTSQDITGRVQAEAAAKESEDRFRVMAESCPLGIWVTAPSGKIAYDNQTNRNLWGVDPEKADDVAWRSMLHEDDAPNLVEAFNLAFKEHSSFTSTYRARRASGGWRWVESHAVPRFSADGEFLGLVGTSQDITGRVQAEAAAKESEDRFRIMAESCPIGIWVTNPQGEMAYGNRMNRDLWGAASETLNPAAWLSSVHEADGVRLFEAFSRALEEHTPFKSAARVRNASSEWRWVESHATPRLSPDGEFLGFVGTSQDVTERKQAELAAKESEERFRTLADGCPMPLWIANTKGEIEFANLAIRQFSGEKFDRFRALNWRREIHPDDVAAFTEEWTKAIKEQRSLSVETRVRRFDGEWRWRAVYMAPRFSPDQEFLGHVGLGVDITERKLAEDTAKESENRFRAMADGCPMPLWVTNTVAELQFANPTFLQFFGVEHERAQEWKWYQALHEEDLPAFRNERSRAVSKHLPFSMRVRLRRADGNWRWMAIFVAPRIGSDEKFLGFACLAVDVTESVRAEQALQESEERFRELAESIREVFWLKEPGKNEFLYISPAFEQVWEKSHASLVNDPGSRFSAVHPDDVENAREVFARQDRGEPAESEYRIVMADGRVKWIRSRAFPVRDKSGHLVRIAGIATEITSEKIYEAQLIQARAEAEAANSQLSTQNAVLDRERKTLRAFIDNVPDLMYVKDRESRFLIANREVARRMGAESAEDLIGRTDFDFYPFEMAQRFYDNEQQLIRTGEAIFDLEDELPVAATNDTVILLTTKVPLHDHYGRVTGLAGIGRDITARKRGEDALHDSNRQLREATERANQLALEAEAANKAKSEFLANMSHEIRTPMNGALGMLRLLLTSGLAPEQQHYAEVAHNSAQSLLQLIDDILDFSKVEAGKLEIDELDFNLHLLMGELAEAIATRIDEERVEFVCAVAPNVRGLVRGDPGRLRQVLTNLVGNAVKFTQKGEIVVHVDIVSETDTAIVLRFSVRDTGVGIPVNKQKRLFTSFTQADASTTRQYGGTGLGLAISRKLVELMGGTIGLKSKEGEGSELWFTLSLGKQEEYMHLEPSQAPLEGARILLVDDNATNREVLTAQLRSWGAIAQAAESGIAALAAMREAAKSGAPYQAAILDMMMPGMDGAALGEAILADGALMAPPLVMMTSAARRGDALRFKEIGFAAYLVKPVRPSDLFDCLGTVLTGEQPAKHAPLITRYTLEAARRSNARILLVEDNLTNQEVACGMLQRMGWKADVKNNGKEAIQALEMHPYDLVLMDVQMPEMDGFEATKIIRNPHSQVLNHNVPVIATTAHAMDGDSKKCLAAGMSDYISKPIDPAVLFHVVDKWLKLKSDPPKGDLSTDSVPVDRSSSEESPSVSSVFNHDAFLKRMMADEGFAREVAAGFVEELPALVNELKQRVALGDLEPIWKQAHRIKGSAANVGGETLRDICFEIERAAKAGDLARATQWIPDLDAQAARLSKALGEWIG